MAIAPSKLGRFVRQEGFSWPTSNSAAPQDYSASDDTLVRRLRETGLLRWSVSADEVAETFRAARLEHVNGGCSPFNSPHERVRVFLEPHLSAKGRRWAVPLDSLALPDDEERSEGRSWWKFWKR
jgi:hypothetical protein